MSSMRKLIRSLTPPIVADWFRPHLPNRVPNSAPIWSGIYPDFKTVPSSGSGFSGETWLEQTTLATLDAKSGQSRPELLPTNVPAFRAMFSLIIAMLSQSKRDIRILDFGGGMGAAFANLLTTVPQTKAFSHLVIDNQESCQRGAEIFEGDARIQFSPTLPDDLRGFDLCFFGSVLQYIEDYRGLLSHLASGHPTYFFLGFTPAGDIPTFATAQCNVPGSMIPVWFLNVSDLSLEFERLGYELLHRSVHNERTFDMSTFPQSHQLAHMSNLLFVRKGV